MTIEPARSSLKSGIKRFSANRYDH